MLQYGENFHYFIIFCWLYNLNIKSVKMDIFQSKKKGRYSNASCTLDCGVHLLTVGTIKDKITWFIFSSLYVYFSLDRQERDWNASLYKEVFHEWLKAFAICGTKTFLSSCPREAHVNSLTSQRVQNSKRKS